MNDFLLNNYELITYMLEFLAAITGVFCYRKYNSKAVKYFMYFLVVVAFSELINSYVFYVRKDKALSFLIGTKFEKNHWWSTLYWDIGAIVFYVFYFYRVLNTQLFKNILKFSGYIFGVFSFIHIALHWEQFFYQFFAVFDILGTVIITMCSVFYFTEILMSNKILDFYKSINFYISATIFIWWLIITPLSFYSVYFTYEVGKNFYDLDFVSLRNQIFLFSNIFMYLTFIFALIFCKPHEDNELIKNE